MPIVLFPLRAEARPFLNKLFARALAVVSRRNGFKSFRFEFDGRRITVIIIGTRRSLLKLPATGLVPPGADIVLAGVAKALNPRFRVGDVFAVTSVKKEGQAGTISLPLLPGLSLPAVSLVTCDRVVFRSGDAADLADMEGYYAASIFPKLSILRAVSDRDEDLEFLNRCVRNGRLSRIALLRNLTPARVLALVRFTSNLKRASRKLADVLWDLVSRNPADP